MPMKNFYTVSPADLVPGDVLVAVVTLHVGYSRGSGFTYRMYRCGWPDTPVSPYDGVPQGSQLEPPEGMAEAIFPVVGFAGLESEL